MDCKKIGEYIQVKRKAIGLTQAELGDMLGVTSKAVSKWECGVALPDVSLFSDLTKILKIDVAELLNGEDNKNIPLDKKKNIIIYILSVFLILFLFSTLFLGIFYVNNYNKVNIYNLSSERKSFYVEGKLINIGDDSYLSISNVRYVFEKGEDNFYIYNLEYELYYRNDKLIKQEKVDFLKENKEEIYFSDCFRNFSLFVKLDDNIKLNDSDFFTLKFNFMNEKEIIINVDVTIDIDD